MECIRLKRTPRFNIYSQDSDNVGEMRRNTCGGDKLDPFAARENHTGALHCQATSMVKGGFKVPCIKLDQFTGQFDSRFNELMEKHGFVVLTDIEILFKRYPSHMKLIKAFFDEPPAAKEACKGGVYFSERGIPMWHAGYEQCGRVREAYRIPVFAASAPSQPWPCCRLRTAWLTLVHLLQLVCHRALCLTLGTPLDFATPKSCIPMLRAGGVEALVRGTKARGRVEQAHGDCDASTRDNEIQKAEQASSEEEGCERAALEPCHVCNGRRRAEDGDEQRGRSGCCGNDYSCCSSSRADIGKAHGPGTSSSDECDDFSVSYALRYPNDFADPALEAEDLTVGEHVDPSLFVAEPCCGVEGLEIQDRESGKWIPIEALCAGLDSKSGNNLEEAAGRELILFGGKALERATEGKVRGAPHRVRRGDHGPRHCFIYEQKYADFFPPASID